MANVLIIGRSHRHICLITALDAGLHHARCHASVTTAIRSLDREVPDVVILAETVHPLAQSFLVRHLRDRTPGVKVIGIIGRAEEDVAAEHFDAAFDPSADVASLLAIVDAVLLSAPSHTDGNTAY